MKTRRNMPAAPTKTEPDAGYGKSHGYGPGHGGPSGPGDAPATTPTPSSSETSRKGRRPPATER